MMRLVVVLFLGMETIHAFVSTKTIQRDPLWATKEATFGMGCFWKPSEDLLKVPGVQNTVVGYTGRENVASPPNYESVCMSRDWVEGVRVKYDDDEISYETLLDAFFETQEPRMGSRQYGSYIFPHDDEQKKVAEKWVEENQSRTRDDGVVGSMTEIEKLTSFWRAEGYHQEYWQKNRPRIALLIVLLAVSSGILDSVVPSQYLTELHTASSAVTLAQLAYVLFERRFSGGVIEL